MPRPDAVLVHVSSKQGDGLADRITSVLSVAEPILEVDRPNGEMGHVRLDPIGEYLFVTRDPADTYLYPLTHPRRKQPRYRWADHPGSDGMVRVGTLIERPASEPAPAHAAVSTDSASAVNT